MMTQVINGCFNTPLISPNTLTRSLPITVQSQQTRQQACHTAKEIILGKTHLLVVIVGPCSIHDPEAALDYAKRLKKAAANFANELFIIMRVYLEKPRTTIGWRGLINDPHLDGSYDIEYGLTLSRKLLLALNELGIPVATEFLDVLTPLYLGDLISWCTIGARTTESQIHRQLASGLSIPVGFKNNTDGNIQVAIDAVKTANHPQHYISISPTGMPNIISTTGNHQCHIILRGGHQSTNYSAKKVAHAKQKLVQNGLTPKLMIDCSHGNSKEQYQHQAQVALTIAKQIQSGATSIFGIMLESNIVAGKQSINNQPLIYGQSITDACLSWEETLPILENLATAVAIGRAT
jgi:3-deoxy-7-phosphoheptulonate synthase